MVCQLAEAIRSASYSGAQDNGGALTAMLDHADAVINRPASDQDHRTAEDNLGLSTLSDNDRAEVERVLWTGLHTYRPRLLAA